jgi:type IV fimbrial biogenesis protein FimT
MAGFTLLECLIVMGILAILLAMSLSSWRGMAERQEGLQLLRSIADSVALGRSTAIKTGHPVTLCPTADGIVCGSDWNTGHMVFTDANLDRLLGSQDQLLHQASRGKVSGTVIWRAFQNRQYLQFTPLGFTRHQNGSFTWCGGDRSAQTAQQLIINSSGRLRFAVDADGDGFREDSRGRPLSC